jgi:hypothetical protein
MRIAAVLTARSCLSGAEPGPSRARFRSLRFVELSEEDDRAEKAADHATKATSEAGLSQKRIGLF